VRGEVVAKGGTSWNNASSAYSGSNGRQQTVRIIKTATGKYVVAILNETQWQGDHDTEDAAVFPSLKDCLAYLLDRLRLPRWMIDELVEQIGEENVAEDIE
jgi:hypothetical protein